MLDALPIGPRGKVDRAALPPPPTVNRPYRAPVGREQDLADIFGDVLGVDPVGLDDDFFELGGDSLAAVELFVMIDEQFGVQLPPSTLLDAPTVALLSPLLVRRRPRGGSTSVVRLIPTTDADPPGTPLFCVAGGGSPAITLRSLADELGDRHDHLRHPGPWARGARAPRPQRRTLGSALPRGDPSRPTVGPVFPGRILVRRHGRVRDGVPARGGWRRSRAARAARQHRARNQAERG